MAKVHGNRNVAGARRPVRRRLRNVAAGFTASGAVINRRMVPKSMTIEDRNTLRRAHLDSTKMGAIKSVAALEWAERAISPCDERLADGRQIPDDSDVSTAVLSSRTQTTIAAPDQTSTWNVRIYTPPLCDVAFMYETWKTGAAPIGKWITVGYKNINYPTTLLPVTEQASEKFASIYRNGDIYQNTVQFRQSAKGITCYLNVSELYNQGMMTAAQWGQKVQQDAQIVYAEVDTSAFATAPENKAACILLKDVPSDSGSLLTLDPKAVMHPARLGCYLPLKFNQPEQSFMEKQEVAYYAQGQNHQTKLDVPEMGAPVVVWTSNTGQTSGAVSPQFIPVSDETPDHKQVAVLASAGVTNMNCGMVFFEGLDPHASITIKTIASLEVVAAPGVWSAFTHTKPPYDGEEVFKKVHNIQSRLPSAYPHSFNTFGGLLSAVLPALGWAAKTIAGALATRFVNGAQTAISYA